MTKDEKYHLIIPQNEPVAGPALLWKLARFGKFSPLHHSHHSAYCFPELAEASLSNYLRTHRKRLALSQEEVAFLVGAKGMEKGIKVSRDENHAREPSLQTALAYEVIYGTPVRELFAGLYARVERQVGKRAKILRHRRTGKQKPRHDEVITKLVSKVTI